MPYLYKNRIFMLDINEAPARDNVPGAHKVINDEILLRYRNDEDDVREVYRNGVIAQPIRNKVVDILNNFPELVKDKGGFLMLAYILGMEDDKYGKINREVPQDINGIESRAYLLTLQSLYSSKPIMKIVSLEGEKKAMLRIANHPVTLSLFDKNNKDVSAVIDIVVNNSQHISREKGIKGNRYLEIWQAFINVDSSNVRDYVHKISQMRKAYTDFDTFKELFGDTNRIVIGKPKELKQYAKPDTKRDEILKATYLMDLAMTDGQDMGDNRFMIHPKELNTDCIFDLNDYTYSYMDKNGNKIVKTAIDEQITIRDIQNMIIETIKRIKSTLF